MGGRVPAPPFALSPLATFTPTVYGFAASPPPGVLADAIDYSTREFSSLTKGIHPIDEQVLIAITRIRNTGVAVQNVGARFVDIEKIEEGSSPRLESEARIALKRLLERQDISLESVTAAVAGGESDAMVVTVAWHNLRATDQRKRRSFPVKVPNVRGALR
jgi:hypothetical protein